MNKRVHSSLLAVAIGFAVLMVVLGVKDIGDADWESVAPVQQGAQQVPQEQQDNTEPSAQNYDVFIGYAAAMGGGVR